MGHELTEEQIDICNTQIHMPWMNSMANSYSFTNPKGKLVIFNSQSLLTDKLYIDNSTLEE